MKRTIKFAALILSLLFAASLFACSSGGAEPATASGAVEQTDASAAGEYKAFGLSFEEYPDYVIDSAGYFDTVITLNEDGTGTAAAKDESYEIKSWKAEDGKITVDIDGTETTGTVKDGIMIITYYDFSLYLAKEGADKSSVKLISADDFEEKLQEEMPDDEAKDK